jgi:putative (di)nucleoside polyphosphate hydrolase
MSRPAQYFRAGVGAAIINHQGLVLAFERADIPGAWQLPQGGLEALETPQTAVIREVREETGLSEDDLELLEALPEPLAYELPEKFRNKKTGRGQAQYWFLFRLRGVDGSIEVAAGGEFRSWQWLPFDRLLSSVAPFRQGVYRRLAERFGRHLVPSKNRLPGE